MLAFAISIFAGLWTGNDASTILTRAWFAMMLFMMFGACLGWIAQTVIREHLDAAKHATDPQPAPDAGAADHGSTVEVTES